MKLTQKTAEVTDREKIAFYDKLDRTVDRNNEAKIKREKDGGLIIFRMQASKVS